VVRILKEPQVGGHSAIRQSLGEDPLSGAIGKSLMQGTRNIFETRYFARTLVKRCGKNIGAEAESSPRGAASTSSSLGLRSHHRLEPETRSQLQGNRYQIDYNGTYRHDTTVLIVGPRTQVAANPKTRLWLQDLMYLADFEPYIANTCGRDLHYPMHHTPLLEVQPPPNKYPDRSRKPEPTYKRWN
jgi:hypothetical protein